MATHVSVTITPHQWTKVTANPSADFMLTNKSAFVLAWQFSVTDISGPATPASREGLEILEHDEIMERPVSTIGMDLYVSPVTDYENQTATSTLRISEG